MENKNFDDFIKKSLEHLDGEKYIPMDWSSMNEQLDADGLDETLKGSLENLEGAAFIPMDWEMMESKLDAAMAEPKMDADLDPQMDDIYLDAVAYGHLKNIQPAYNHKHWEMMSARLDEEYAYRRKVFVTKLFEAAIVLLLVWTAFNYFPNKKSISAPIAAKPTQDFNSESSNNSANQVLPEDQSSNFQSTIPAVSAVESELSEENKVNKVPPLITNNSSLNFNDISTPVPPISEGKITASPTLEHSNALLSFLENERNQRKSLPIGKTLAFDNDELLKEKLIIQISPLPSLVSSFIDINDLSTDHYFSLAQIIKKKKLRTHEIFFSMYGSADLNFVNSDFYSDEKRAWDVYQTSMYGYGGGFALGFQLKRFLIETGVSYNFISYRQREEASIIGTFDRYVEEQWEDAELNMVHVPLNIQYSFLVKRKWKMYSLTGVSINMALQNNFNFQLEDADPDLTPETLSRSLPVNESEIVNESLLYKGILEGGGLKENSYLTANIGLGIERKFTYRWSLFLQPVYRHHFLIDGIGPNEDRIHSGSIRFGAKVKIR